MVSDFSSSKPNQLLLNCTQHPVVIQRATTLDKNEVNQGNRVTLDFNSTLRIEQQLKNLLYLTTHTTFKFCNKPPQPATRVLLLNGPTTNSRWKRMWAFPQHMNKGFHHPKARRAMIRTTKPHATQIFGKGSIMRNLPYENSKTFKKMQFPNRSKQRDSIMVLYFNEIATFNRKVSIALEFPTNMICA